jgi:hypothetical protein
MFWPGRAKDLHGRLGFWLQNRDGIPIGHRIATGGAEIAVKPRKDLAKQIRTSGSPFVLRCAS